MPWALRTANNCVARVAPFGDGSLTLIWGGVALRARRRVNADELRIRRVTDGPNVHWRGYFSNWKLDRVRGKARGATDASVILSISISDRCLAHAMTGTCTAEARRSCGAHRSQWIADIEREIIGCSTEEDHQGDETQGHAMHR